MWVALVVGSSVNSVTNNELQTKIQKKVIIEYTNAFASLVAGITGA